MSNYLQDEEKRELLGGLIDGSHSFSEVEKESNDLKSTRAFKDALVKEVGCTWEVAAKKVPQYTGDLASIQRQYKVVRGKLLPSDFKVIYVFPKCPECEYYM